MGPNKAPRGYKVTAVVIGLFGLITLFASSAVLFNVGGARAMAGAVVPIVPGMNLLAAFFYIVSAYAIYRLRPWAPLPLLMAIAALVVAIVAFLVHVQQGGPYEVRTVGALSFRVAVTLLFYLVARYFVRPFKANV